MPRLQIDAVAVSELPAGVALGAIEAGGRAAEVCLAASTGRRPISDS